MIVSGARPAIAALAIAILSILPGLGSATLWEPDEPRFAEATRQMFHRGDFVTPYFNGVPRFEKPILFYWEQAIAYAVFGDTELAARLPSALSGIGCVLILFALGQRFVSTRAGLLAAAVLATMFRFVTFSRLGLTDIPVLFFIVATLYAFVRATAGGSRLSALVGWACVGLGVLTKGPVGLLSLAIWTAYAVVRRDWALVSGVRPSIGGLLAIAIAVPWYAFMMLEHGRAFVDFALGHEIAERVASESAFAPTRGFFYYYKVWLGDAAPWSVLFVAGGAWIAIRWRELDAETHRAAIFALTWFFSVFVLFSLSRSKVPHYVLPAYPAAALLIGIFVDRLAERARDAIFWRVPMAIIAVAMLAAAMVIALFVAALSTVEGVLVAWVAPLVLAGGGIAVGHAVARRRAVTATAIASGSLACAFGVIAAIVVPAAIEGFKPMPRLARLAAATTAADAPVGLLGRYGASSLIYYSHRNVRWLENDDETVAFLLGSPDALCVMPSIDFARLAPRLGAGVTSVAEAEEFNVRLERLLERQPTPGRKWVLVSSGLTY